jgi:hypothetical protein
METPQAIAQVAADQPAISSHPAQASPPWQFDVVPTPAMAGLRQSARAVRSRPAAEMVDWSIVALTLLTAASVLFGTYGGKASRPTELLPVMIVAPAR